MLLKILSIIFPVFAIAGVVYLYSRYRRPDMALINQLNMDLFVPALQQSLLLTFGALPPAVLNYLVAEKYHQEPEKVASIVMLANLGSLLVKPFALVLALS